MSARERIGFTALATLAMFVVLVVVSLSGWLVTGGWSVLSWSFLTEMPRDGMTAGGIYPAILGTVALTLISALLATPLGVGAAIHLAEYAKEGWFLRVVRLSIRSLSGVPSVVYGLFGVGIFVQGMGLGMSMLASGLTLGLLTLPATITASEEALRTVPRAWRDGALALGATRWQAIRGNVLPAAVPGILTGVILGLARAAGETAPILFTGVTFSRAELPDSVLDTYMALPYHLYVLATQHHDISHVRPIAFGTATVLLAIVLVFNASAALLRSRMRAVRA